MPVVKNIILPVQPQHAAMVIPGKIARMALVCNPVQKHVPVADKRTPERKAPVRAAAYCIAQFMIVPGRIDKIIPPVILAD